MYKHTYYYKEHDDILREGYDYAWKDKDDGYNSTMVENIEPSNLKHNKESSYDKNNDSYIAKAITNDQKLVSGASLKFKTAVINDKSKIIFERNGFRFKLKKGSYHLNFSAQLDDYIKGTLYLNISNHDDIKHDINGKNISKSFKITIDNDSYINLKFKLPNSINLVDAVLIIK